MITSIPPTLACDIEKKVRADEGFLPDGQVTITVCPLCLRVMVRASSPVRAAGAPDILWTKDPPTLCVRCERVGVEFPKLVDWTSAVISAHARCLSALQVDGIVKRPLCMMRIGSVETPPPQYMHEGDAGLDLAAAVRADISCRSPEGTTCPRGFYLTDARGVPWHEGAAVQPAKLTLPPGASAVVPTGWAFQIPPGFEGQVRGRSGQSEKRALVVTGTIDATYRGEVCFHLLNQSGDRLDVRTGGRFAQLVIAPVAQAAPEIVEALAPGERGTNGFGSTG